MRFWMFPLAVVLVVGSDLAAEENVGGQCRNDAVFPDKNWTEAMIQSEAIKSLEGYAFDPALNWADPERKGVRTDSVVVIQHGKIVYERYAHTYSATSVHLGWSMSKTVMQMLAGVAVREGSLNIDTSICAYLPETDASHCTMTVKNLLEFGSGLDWHETYEGSSPTSSSVLAMLYGEGQPEMAKFVLKTPSRDAPGTSYMYSSGDTNVLSAIVHKALMPKHGARYPWTTLFEPLEMSGVTWERDGAGVPVGSSYLYATSRDYARLGLLWRVVGCWKGQRILPVGWVAAASQVSAPFQHKALGIEPGDVQGRQLWLNVAVGQAARPWPQVPDDAVAMMGHWGQSITMIPSKDLVVVRTADDRDGRFSMDHFLALVLAVVGEGPVPGPVPVQGESMGVPGPKLPSYDTGLLTLASRFAAKETCSCRFVLGMDADFCKDVTRVSPDVAHARVDVDDKTVHARALGFWGAEAKWVNAEEGCVIVP